MDKRFLFRAETHILGNCLVSFISRALETQIVVYTPGMGIDAPFQPLQDCFAFNRFAVETRILGIQSRLDTTSILLPGNLCYVGMVGRKVQESEGGEGGEVRGE